MPRLFHTGAILALAALTSLATACGDPGATGGAAASAGVPDASAGVPAASAGVPDASAGVPAASASAGVPAAAEELDPNTTAGEPERRTLRATADDPALWANRDAVADSYGVARLPLPLELQAVPLLHDRRALLLTGQGAALGKPLILVVGPDNALLWSKDRPLAGTRERAAELTLSRGPHGEVLLFWYDEPTNIFAGREWTHDGGIFADYDILSSEGCDGATVLFWPGRGWVAALVDGAVLRAQMLGENGSRSWSGNGIEVPLPAPGTRPPGRPKIAIRGGSVIEIAVGQRKVAVSPEGAVLK